jgi:hypothetical protein
MINYSGNALLTCSQEYRLPGNASGNPADTAAAATDVLRSYYSGAPRRRRQTSFAFLCLSVQNRFAATDKQYFCAVRSFGGGGDQTKVITSSTYTRVIVVIGSSKTGVNTFNHKNLMSLVL